MEPVFLTIEDFMSHRRTCIDFTQFQSALIMGQFRSDPRESNGVGKTVIFHAIEYVLFGTYPTKTVDKVVREGTDVAQVTLDFIAKDGNTWRVQRKRNLGRSTDVQLWKLNGSKWIPQSQRTPSDTHKAVLDLIGINVNSFKNSVQFSQNNLDGLISTRGKEASAEDRRNILKDGINLSEYQRYEKLAKDRAGEISKKMDARKAVIESIGDPQSDIEDFKKKIIETKQLILEKDKRRDELNLLIRSRKKELDDLQRLVSSEAQSIHEKLADLKSAKGTTLGNIKVARESIIENENKIESLLNKQNHKLTELKDMETRSDDIRAKKRRPIHQVKKECESTAQNELNGKAYISSLERKAQELKRPMPDGHECPTCRQGLSDEYKDTCKDKIQEELEEVLNEIADKKPKLKKCTNKKVRLQNELEEINKAISYISSLDGKIEGKKQEIYNDGDYITRLQELNSHQKANLEIMSKKLEEQEKREKSLQESLKGVSNDEIEEKIIKVKRGISELEYLLHGVTDELNNENSQLGIYNARIEDRKESLEKLDEENRKLTDLDYQYQIYKRVRQAFSSSGIPTMIIHSILDDLQMEANKLLSELKPGLEIQFTPDIDLLYKYHGSEREFGQLSGGQKFIIALSLKLGLSLIIQRRLGVNIKLLQLDEVDQPLDHSARDAYADAIRKLQNKFKILVITHNDTLKDKFSNVILVEGDDYNGATSKLMTF
jgi:DNA repair exonuclease SbcCD ATPase subunit